METPEEAKKVFKTEGVLDVQPYSDLSYIIFIKEIINRSRLLTSFVTSNNSTQELYECILDDDVLRCRFRKDNSDDLYYDIVEYWFMSSTRKAYPISFTISTPKEVYVLFFASKISCEVVSYRLYGQPKLSKPKELKNTKQSFSVDFIPRKCKCQCYVKGDDLWIKHRDFFSSTHRPDPEDVGTPLSYRARKYFNLDKSYIDKFIYPDSWGEIVLRNEAWIVFRNFRQAVHKDKHFPIKSMTKAFLNTDILKKANINELSRDWVEFFSNLCKEYLKYSTRKEVKQ